jgi:hypothetical protein
MNTGIQDAWNISWKLALVLRGDALPGLVDSYEPERFPVAHSILNSTDQFFTMFTSQKPLWKMLRPILAPLLPDIVSHFGIGKRLSRNTSQTWIAYRDSAVVAGDRSTKYARPGDRAPHALFETGERSGQSIYGLLCGVDHHMLLFTGAEFDMESSATEIHSILQNYRVAVHTHVMDAAQKAIYSAYAVREPTAFLVRPDGHIAWRGKLKNLNNLEAYMDQWYVRN